MPVDYDPFQQEARPNVWPVAYDPLEGADADASGPSLNSYASPSSVPSSNSPFAYGAGLMQWLQQKAPSDDGRSVPGVLAQGATRMSCSDAHTACRTSGRSLATCLKAFINCGKGSPTIFAPGIWGDPNF
jgi:hypothetical protein